MRLQRGVSWTAALLLTAALCSQVLAQDSRWVWGDNNRRSGRIGFNSDREFGPDGGRPVLAFNGNSYGLGGGRPLGPNGPNGPIGGGPFPPNRPPGSPAPVHELQYEPSGPGGPPIQQGPLFQPLLRPPRPPQGGFLPFPPNNRPPFGSTGPFNGPFSEGLGGGFQGGILPGSSRPHAGAGFPPRPLLSPGGGVGPGGPFPGGPGGPGGAGPFPSGPGGVGGGGGGAPVPPYEDPYLKDPPPHTGGFDTCKCALSFNCNSPGIKFGECDEGKQYCCYNSHVSGSNRRPSNLPFNGGAGGPPPINGGPLPGGVGGPRPGQGVLVGPGGPYDFPPDGPGPYNAKNSKNLAFKNKL